eukprot:ANDGO_04987.mRNA.1 hypothetical protein
MSRAMSSSRTSSNASSNGAAPNMSISRPLIEGLASSKVFTDYQVSTLNSSDALVASTKQFVFGAGGNGAEKSVSVIAKGSLEEADGQALVGLVAERRTAESQKMKGLFKTVYLSPCGRSVVYQAFSGTVRVMDCEAKDRQQDLFGTSPDATLFGCFSSNGEYFACVTSTTMQLAVFKRQTDGTFENVFASGCPLDPVSAIACETTEHDHSLLVALAGGREFLILGIRNLGNVSVEQICERRSADSSCSGSIRSLGFGHEAKLLAIMIDNGGIVWNVRDQIRFFELDRGAPSAQQSPVSKAHNLSAPYVPCAFSSDGWYLAAVISDSRVCIWTANNGAFSRICDHGNGSVVSSARFLNQTVQLVTTFRTVENQADGLGHHNKLKVWSADDGSTSALTSRYQATETDAVVSAVTLLWDSSAVELWRVFRAAEQATLTPETPCCVLANSILLLDASPLQKSHHEVRVHVYPIESTKNVIKMTTDRDELRDQVKKLAQQAQQPNFGIKDILVVVLAIVLFYVLLGKK